MMKKIRKTVDFNGRGRGVYSGNGENLSGRKGSGKVLLVIVCAVVIFAAGGVTAVAAETDPLEVVGNLSDFIFGLVRAIGMILLGFGIVQIGLSLKSHDPSQRANGMLTAAGGLVITFAKEILDLITGG